LSSSWSGLINFVQVVAMKPQIPIFSLQGSGMDSFDIHHVTADLDLNRLSMPHRDKNYILGFQASGTCKMVVDFKEIVISGAAIFCILPGQIHHGVGLQDINAWIIPVDGALLEPSTRQVFIESAIRGQPIALEAQEAEAIERSLMLLEALKLSTFNVNFEQAQRCMLATCIALFKSVYQHGPRSVPQSGLRPSIITSAFLALLLENFRTMKSPKSYASALNVSPSYLNEVVKNTTGFAVSYWIQQEVMMEAKRLLYYTNDTVKEIAVWLGYTDAAYFIRLFQKVVGDSPLRFRERSRQFSDTNPDQIHSA
jgi:AraC family transcriptional activator of pobA